VIVLPGPAVLPGRHPVGVPGEDPTGEDPTGEDPTGEDPTAVAHAVLLDRDGTLIEDVPAYVRSDADIRLLPRVGAAAATFAGLGVRLAIVSNQAAIGRGLLTREQVVTLHGQVVDRLRVAGLPVTLSTLCPHAPDDGCPCRKPRPGLLSEAARLLGVPPQRCLVIGDAARDVEASRAAGMHPLLVLTGHGPAARAALAAAGDEVEVCTDIADAALRVATLLQAARAAG
jgi:D-glycero-D-manno-heptose 1,7-bisphosphate phosphatase